MFEIGASAILVYSEDFSRRSLFVINKPSLEDVLKYTRKQIRKYIATLASSLPFEQKEEIEQNAYVRVISAYEKLDASKGWMAFVQRHARGSVLDYIRSGTGFEEVGISQDEEMQKRFPWKIKNRLGTIELEDGEQLDVETIAGINGIFHIQNEEKEITPNWNLIARLASENLNIHLVGKLLLGFTQTELSEMFGVTRERLTQRLKEFCESLDRVENLKSRWIEQTIYAFGLSEKFGMPERDLGFGWDWDPVDLWATDVRYLNIIDKQLKFDI